MTNYQWFLKLNQNPRELGSLGPLIFAGTPTKVKRSYDDAPEYINRISDLLSGNCAFDSKYSTHKQLYRRSTILWLHNEHVSSHCRPASNHTALGFNILNFHMAQSSPVNEKLRIYCIPRISPGNASAPPHLPFSWDDQPSTISLTPPQSGEAVDQVPLFAYCGKFCLI